MLIYYRTGYKNTQYNHLRKGFYDMKERNKKHSVLKRLLIVIVVIGCILGGVFYMSQNKPAEKKQEVYAGKDLIQENGKNEVTFESYDLKNIGQEIIYIFKIDAVDLEKKDGVKSGRDYLKLIETYGIISGGANRYIKEYNGSINNMCSDWSSLIEEKEFKLDGPETDVTITVVKREKTEDKGFIDGNTGDIFYEITVEYCADQLYYITTEKADIKKVFSIFADEINFQFDGETYSFKKTEPNYKKFDLEKRYENIFHVYTYETDKRTENEQEVEDFVKNYAKEHGYNFQYDTAENDGNYGPTGIYSNAEYGYSCMSDDAKGEISIAVIKYKTHDEAVAPITSIPKGEYNSKTGVRTVEGSGLYLVHFTKDNLYIKVYTGSSYKTELNNFVKEYFNIIV